MKSSGQELGQPDYFFRYDLVRAFFSKNLFQGLTQ